MIYTFIREDGFYTIYLSSDAEAIANAKANPGTKEVYNESTQTKIYEEQ